MVLRIRLAYKSKVIKLSYEYLVTGAAGFIGSAVVTRLASQGKNVVAVDGLIESNYSKVVKENKWNWLQNNYPNVKFLKGDLRNPDFVESLPKVKSFINLAAVPGLVLSWNNFDLYLSCNVSAVKNILDYAVKNKIENFIHASTSSVYGAVAHGNETSGLNPVSPYGVSKLAAENLIKAFNENFGLDYKVLRYFSVYGPNQRPDMAYSIFCRKLLQGETIKIYGDGSQVRTNTYIDDVARVTIEVCELKDRQNEVYNVAGETPITVLDALLKLAEHLQVDPKFEFFPKRPGDQRTTLGDISKLVKDGIRVNSVTLEEGLRNQALAAKTEFLRKKD